ncbi:hypothetical protein D081_1451 [Anaerovibrio sp. JC8]|uniref:hypothetical protein n=1 Tax=Anaerovibrio sp. JC8 TaxID=1240085 RepID=UPI000A098818|nr:hypothetical protein [Anaerovibrio sp. JC8]ORT99870.1 hypothetical protein D081_1451 [Anaerovibrio sp. JC8]
MTAVKKLNGWMDEMENMVVTGLVENKLMADDELDNVAGGYTYGRIDKTVRNGIVTFKMRNLNTGKDEIYTGKTAEEAMLKLVQHNYNHYEKTIYLTGPKGDVLHTLDVESTAKALKLKRR